MTRLTTPQSTFRTTMLISIAVLVGTALITGCAKRPEGQPDRPLVVTSIAPLGSLIRNIAGTRAQVETLTPYGYRHVARSIGEGDRNLVKFAMIGIFSGLGYDDELANAFRNVVPDNVPTVFLGANAITPDALLPSGLPGTTSTVANPFLWTDPVLARSYAEQIKVALTKIDPSGSAHYEGNLLQVTAALDRINRAISETISTIPTHLRVLFTETNAFEYFGKRYRLESLGAIRYFDLAGNGQMTRVGASDTDLAMQIRATGLPVIFATNSPVSAEVEAIARAASVRFIGMLRYEELPGAPGSLGHTYFGMLIDNARNIAGLLGGSSEALESVRPNDVVPT